MSSFYKHFEGLAELHWKEMTAKGYVFVKILPRQPGDQPRYKWCNAAKFQAFKRDEPHRWVQIMAYSRVNDRHIIDEMFDNSESKVRISAYLG